jgi:methionine-S-sulfoxide reductase
MEAAFEHLEGVRDALSGYTGGPEVQPSYEEVSNHGTGHAEAVRVLYDPARVTYEQLLELYWHRINPTTPDQAFADRGHQYRSVIYVHSPAQRAAAERSLQAIRALPQFRAGVVTTIEDAVVFWVAEGYHQNFWRTNPEHYESYHEHSGRREYLRSVWGPNAPY